MDVKQYMGGILAALFFGWVLPAIYFYGFMCVVPKLIVSFVVGVFVVDRNLGHTGQRREESMKEDL